jgi:hypothetical protein
MFYGLTAEELKGRRPLSKFLAIKLIVVFTFYQSFVVSMYRSLLSSLVTIQFSLVLWNTEFFMVDLLLSPSSCAHFLRSNAILDSDQYSQWTERPCHLYRGKPLSFLLQVSS